MIYFSRKNLKWQTNFADDCSPSDFSVNTDEVINRLEEPSTLLIEWYKYNYLKPNPDKWHLILSERIH